MLNLSSFLHFYTMKELLNHQILFIFLYTLLQCSEIYRMSCILLLDLLAKNCFIFIFRIRIYDVLYLLVFQGNKNAYAACSVFFFFVIILNKIENSNNLNSTCVLFYWSYFIEYTICILLCTLCNCILDKFYV